MEDIRRQDQRLFVRELLRPGNVLVTLGGASLLALLGRYLGPSYAISAFCLPFVVHTYTAHNRSLHCRWLNKRYEAIWTSVQDRLERFEEVLAKMRRDQIADLQEMPRTIRRVADSIYLALRRADIISHEVQQTEKGILSQPPAWTSLSNDAQAKELYRIADKNIAEYRQHYAGVMAGVQRAEAQSAVYMTTLDSLRMKMIGYRLVGRQPDLTSHDFLEAMSEAKLQLNAIDQALEELDFRQFPQMISVIPEVPPIPTASEEPPPFHQY